MWHFWSLCPGCCDQAKALFGVACDVQLPCGVKSLGVLPCRDQVWKQSCQTVPVPHHVCAVFEHRAGSLKEKNQSLADKAIAHRMFGWERAELYPLLHLAGAEEEGGHVQHEEAIPPRALRLQP